MLPSVQLFRERLSNNTVRDNAELLWVMEVLWVMGFHSPSIEALGVSAT